jgi:group I intron endonuclease
VYVFTNKITGEQYVGSSINLGSRVRYYFKPSVRATENRLIIQSLNKYGVENFTLSIYKIDPKLFETQFKPLEYSRALEQYYIFTSNSVLNNIKVAGANPGGPMDENTKLSIGKANRKPLYVYNHDRVRIRLKADSEINSSLYCCICFITVTLSTIE